MKNSLATLKMKDSVFQHHGEVRYAHK